MAVNDEILAELKQLNANAIKILYAILKKPPEAVLLDAATLLTLPDHLRKTAMEVLTHGRVMSSEVSTLTKRARAVESAYLNQLVILGYLKKERQGRRVYFMLPEEEKK